VHIGDATADEDTETANSKDHEECPSPLMTEAYAKKMGIRLLMTSRRASLTRRRHVSVLVDDRGTLYSIVDADRIHVGTWATLTEKRPHEC
jgi:hypothetical protein